MQIKLCSKCHQEKELNQFNFRNKSKGSYHSCCKLCKSKNRLGLCKCGKIKDRRSKKCNNCKSQTMRNKAMKLTLGEKTYNNHKYAKYQFIRYYARQLGLEYGFDRCAKCGYNKHFEVCHIKSISSFSKETTIEEINQISNLIPLCPNCHWEFDNLESI